MVLLYTIIIGNTEMDGFTWKEEMDGLAACEQTKEIIQTSNCMFRFVTKQYSYKYSHPPTEGALSSHTLCHVA